MKKYFVGLLLQVISCVLSCHIFARQEPKLIRQEQIDHTVLFELCDNFMHGKIKGDAAFENQLTELLAAGININSARDSSGNPVLCHIIVSLGAKKVSRDGVHLYENYEYLFFDGHAFDHRNMLRSLCLSMLKTLDKYGADIHECVLDTQSSPLHIAVEIGELEIIECLLNSASFKRGIGKAFSLHNNAKLTANDLAMEIYSRSMAEHKNLRAKAAKATNNQKKRILNIACQKASALEFHYRKINQLFLRAFLAVPSVDMLSGQDEVRSYLLKTMESDGLLKG